MLQSDSGENTAGDNLATQVRPAAGRCLDAFASAIQASSSHHINRDEATPDPAPLVIERDRFRVWAANAAAFAKGQSSLDYRLRQLPEELALVKSLVESIYSQLQSYTSATKRAEQNVAVDRSATTAGSEAPRTSSSRPQLDTENEAEIASDKVKSETFQFVDALESIHTSIDWLHRLSNLLRKASIVNQNLHAQSCRLPDVNFEGLGTFFEYLVARDFPGLSAQLTSRMSRAMVERNRRILYRRHRYRLGWQQQEEFGYAQKPSPIEDTDERVLPSKNSQSLASESPMKQPKTAKLEAEEAPSLSSKIAVTEPDPSKYKSRSIVSTARSAALDHDAEKMLPPAPNECQTETNFTCEFCCMILPSEIGTSRASWSKHLQRDLDSYVCLFDRCTQPYSLFSSSQEWLYHMRSEHLVKWTCPVEDSLIEFGTKEELTQHMYQLHLDIFDAKALPFIVEACRESLETVFEACPFCDKTPQSDIEDHVGRHLRYLALKSIPWPNYDGEGLGSETEESESLELLNNNRDRETLGGSFGWFRHGSLYFDDDRGSVASEYGGDVFLNSAEQRQTPRSEWVHTQGLKDERQAEWGFVHEIHVQHEEWRAKLREQPPLPKALTELMPPPKALTELMTDNHEVKLFESFKPASSNDLHPGFRQKTLYNDQRAVFSPLPSTSVEFAPYFEKATKQHSRILSTTVSEAMRHSDLGLDFESDPQECSWEDVLICIDKAKMTHEAKGRSNKTRAWSSNGEATADILKSLTGMIPDEEGLKVLRQGLVIILQAWPIRVRNKEEVLRQFEDLPLLLSSATEKWKLYPRDERLKHAVRSFYETVVGSLSELINILLRAQAGSFISKNVHGIPAVVSQHIDEISNTVTRARAALEASLSSLDPERLAKIYNTSTNALSEAQAIREAVSNTHNVMMQAVADIVARQRESRLIDDSTTREMLKESFREVLASQMQTGLYQLVEETEYARRLGYDADRDTAPSEDAAKVVLSKEDLMQHLDLTLIDSIAEDIERIRQQATKMAPEGRELARKIMAMQQFTEWVTKDDSRLLLLDEYWKNLGPGKTSPLSVLCTSLASTLAESESLLILQYYCGHHAIDLNGLPAGPLGLIRSLLSQLLCKVDNVLPRTLQIDRELYERARLNDIDDLCEIFWTVFSQIVHNKITLCIIDGVAEFEGTRSRWDRGMSLIVSKLRWIVHQHQGSQRLKVLMTSANKSAVVGQLLEESDKISFRGNRLADYPPRRLVMSSGSSST